jgi:hypothetical protein
MARTNYRHQKKLREQAKKKRNEEKKLRKSKPADAPVPEPST